MTTSGAGAEDHRNLRHHARGERVAVEDFTVAGERVHAFLDARAAGVVDADDGDAEVDRVVHHLGDLARVHVAERAAGDGEVLRVDAHRLARDGAGAGDHAVGSELLAVHAEILAFVLDEKIVFVEGTGVEQGLDPFACGKLATGLLFADRLVATALGCGAFTAEKVDDSLSE